MDQSSVEDSPHNRLISPEALSIITMHFFHSAINVERVCGS